MEWTAGRQGRVVVGVMGKRGPRVQTSSSEMDGPGDVVCWMVSTVNRMGVCLTAAERADLRGCPHRKPFLPHADQATWRALSCLCSASATRHAVVMPGAYEWPFRDFSRI